MSNPLPRFMYWKPIGRGVSKATYRWWAVPFAPLYRAWTSYRLRRVTRRIKKREGLT